MITKREMQIIERFWAAKGYDTSRGMKNGLPIGFEPSDRPKLVRAYGEQFGKFQPSEADKPETSKKKPKIEDQIEAALKSNKRLSASAIMDQLLQRYAENYVRSKLCEMVNQQRLVRVKGAGGCLIYRLSSGKAATDEPPTKNKKRAKREAMSAGIERILREGGPQTSRQIKDQMSGAFYDSYFGKVLIDLQKSFRVEKKIGRGGAPIYGLISQGQAVR